MSVPRDLLAHMNLQTALGGTLTLRGNAFTWRITGTASPQLMDTLEADVTEFLRRWKPTAHTQPLPPDTYTELAYARQCFDLARDAAELSSSQLYWHIKRLRESLGRLKRVDPRFTYLHSTAIAAEQLIGEFEIEDGMGAWEELAAIMPQPLHAPLPWAESYIVVDDSQTNAQFARSLAPSRQLLHARPETHLPDTDFIRPGRMVFPSGIFDDTHPAFLAVDRAIGTSRVTFVAHLVDDGSHEAFSLARELRMLIDGTLQRELSPTTPTIPTVEAVASLAYVHACAQLLTQQQARFDTARQAQLLAEIVTSLDHITDRQWCGSGDAALARTLANRALRACEAHDSPKLVSCVNAMLEWLPENLAPRVPANLDHPDEYNVASRILDSLRAEEDVAGFYGVVNTQLEALFSDSGFPSRIHMAVVPLGAHPNPEAFTRHDFVFGL